MNKIIIYGEWAYKWILKWLDLTECICLDHLKVTNRKLEKDFLGQKQKNQNSENSVL